MSQDHQVEPPPRDRDAAQEHYSDENISSNNTNSTLSSSGGLSTNFVRYTVKTLKITPASAPHLRVAAHQRDLLLAVASPPPQNEQPLESYQGEVQILSGEVLGLLSLDRNNFVKGELLSSLPSRTTGCYASVLSWHPMTHVLAIGWSNGLHLPIFPCQMHKGAIGLWTEGEASPSDFAGLHRTPLTTLEWDPAGTRLISCDDVCLNHFPFLTKCKLGVVLAWRYQPGANPLTQTMQQTVSGCVTHCLFRSNARGYYFNGFCALIVQI